MGARTLGGAEYESFGGRDRDDLAWLITTAAVQLDEFRPGPPPQTDRLVVPSERGRAAVASAALALGKSIVQPLPRHDGTMYS